MSSEKKQILENKLNPIESWINSPSLNEGHQANLLNESDKSLWRQEIDNRATLLTTFDYLLNKYLELGYITEDEASILLDRKKSLENRFDAQAKKIKERFEGTN